MPTIEDIVRNIPSPTPEQERLTRYRKVDDGLRAHCGEFLLLLRRHEGGRSVSPHESWYLAQIAESGLTVNAEGKIATIPVSRAAVQYRLNGLDHNSPELLATDGLGVFTESLSGISRDTFVIGEHLDKKSGWDAGITDLAGRQPHGSYWCSFIELQMVFGDQAVKEFFANRGRQGLITFGEMCQLIGHDSQHDPDVKTAIDQEIARLVAELLKNFQGLQRLQEAIVSVYEHVRGGGTGFIRDGALVLCESEGDAFWTTLGNRQRLPEAQGRAKRILAALSKLGVDKAQAFQMMGALYAQIIERLAIPQE